MLKLFYIFLVAGKVTYAEEMPVNNLTACIDRVMVIETHADSMTGPDNVITTNEGARMRRGDFQAFCVVGIKMPALGE